METTFSIYSKIETEKLMSEESEASVFSRQEVLDDWNQEKNENAKVVIIGAGGFGTIATDLARIGIGHIVICDGAWWICDVETVTKHEYDQLKVGVIYSVDKVRSLAYMKNK